MLKRQKLAADMAELATLRLRVEVAEKKASMNERSYSFWLVAVNAEDKRKDPEGGV